MVYISQALTVSGSVRHYRLKRTVLSVSMALPSLNSYRRAPVRFLSRSKVSSAWHDTVCLVIVDLVLHTAFYY